MRSLKQLTALPLVWEIDTRPVVHGYVDDRDALAEIHVDDFASGTRVFVNAERAIYTLELGAAAVDASMVDAACASRSGRWVRT